MDRRTLLALGLTAVVIVATPMIFPSPKRERPAITDTTPGAARDTTQPAAPVPATRAPATVVEQLPTLRPIVPATTRPETTVVRTRHTLLRIVSPGGTPAEVTLPDHHSLREGAGDTPVNLLEPGDRLFRLAIVNAADTIALDTIAFRAAPQRLEGATIVQAFTSISTADPITLTYRFPADSFVMRLEGAIGIARGDGASRRLLVTLPRRIRSDEANVQDDTRHLAFAYKPGASEVASTTFRDLEPGSVKADTGAFRWMAERNKYFVVAVQPVEPDSVFRGVHMRGGPRQNGEATSAGATAVLPLATNSFALRVYAGPQSWNHLRQTAGDLENVNPYGGFAHSLVQPFATIVMRMLLWIHEFFNVGYGWVLVIFGVLVRLLLWPLNQSAMRSSMKLQRIQPQLAELQKKYRDTPEKQREAMMKLYQEHGMSPFTPILGCLPMLLPMPILFALYFVFQNTIELRGVPFLWMPDLSLRDPLFITPLFMGVSMFVLSWIGMRGMPPSPQGKMMSYVMPVMFTALFWNFASGLNLYYAVQNVAALPQQWLLARERTGAKTAAGNKREGEAGKQKAGGGQREAASARSAAKKE